MSVEIDKRIAECHSISSIFSAQFGRAVKRIRRNIDINQGIIFMLIVKMIKKVITYFSSIAILILGIASVALLIIIFKEEGIMGVWITMKSDMKVVTIKFIPVLIVFFTITGALNHLQSKHSDEFKGILAGKKGTVKMVLLAASLPGPAGGQQLQDVWNEKGSDKTNLLICLVGMMALNSTMVLFRSKVLGGPLTLIWLSLATIFLFEVWFVCRFKPWSWF